jgi:hypothetical protein
MAKDNSDAPPPTDGSGMVTVLIGDAAALGQDTFASVAETLSLTDHGKLAKGTGAVVAIAISDGSEDGASFVSAYAALDPDQLEADKVHIKTATISGEQDGTSYEISVLTFKAKDHANKDGDIDIKIQDKSDHGNQIHDIADLTIHLDGNVAIATIDAHASAENTSITVEASVLAVEDELSLSTIVTTGAVG